MAAPLFGPASSADSSRVTLCLCGDVMTGRGIDQVLPHPCDPVLYEEGYEEFRDDLGLLYFVTLDRMTGRLERLRMTPTRISGFQVHRASGPAADWLAGNARGGDSARR
jgi:poly-gamma-glutamate capsule biosynthesis protein CapA/YwtB (metallophosphatase superfamily)